MIDWWEGLLKMLGLRPVATPPPVSKTDAEQDAAIALARRRLQALDTKLEIVSKRLTAHERRTH